MKNKTSFQKGHKPYLVSHTKKTKKKIGKASRERWSNSKYKEKMKNIHKKLFENKEFKEQKLKTFNHNKTHTKKTKEKIRNSIKKSWKSTDRLLKSIIALTGREISEKTKIKLHNYMKIQWNDNEYREKQLKLILKGTMKRPTNLESKFDNELFIPYKLPFNYCGNGSLLIGYKNPDYVESNDKKICLEVGNKIEKSIKRKGRFYHSWQEYEQQRINHFAMYGWKCLCLWEDELSNKEKLLDKINKFLNICPNRTRKVDLFKDLKPLTEGDFEIV